MQLISSRTSLLTCLVAGSLLVPTGSALAAPGKGYTYGPKGSCKITVKGKKVSGHKEYRNGRPTGRCVVQ